MRKQDNLDEAMPVVYLCTLGQRPEAITLALDILSETYAYEKVVILHTEPNFSGIADAYQQIMSVLRSDYPDLPIESRQLCFVGGAPIMDIQDPHSASAYHLSLLNALIEYKTLGYTLHLMVAGGRKAMSIYATLAATLVMNGADRVMTIVSPPEIVMRSGAFHVPAEWQKRIHVVELPFAASRLVPGYVQDLLSGSGGQTTRQLLWKRLSPQEQALAVVLQNHPHASNRELAVMMGKQSSTIDNQLRSIYAQLAQFCEVKNRARKRQLLIDVIAGRI